MSISKQRLCIVWTMLLLGCGTSVTTTTTTTTTDDTTTTTTTDDTTTTSSTSTLSSIQSNIFTSTCATSGCHSSTSASGGLSLASGEAFAALVGTASSELSTMNRVTAGDTALSYLIHKLEGTQATVGGSGSTMPKGGTALTAAQLTTIKEWITAGALDN